MRCKQAMGTWLVTRRSLLGSFGSRGWQPVGQVGRAPHCLLLSARLFHPEKGGRRLHRQITCSKCKKNNPPERKKERASAISHMLLHPPEAPQPTIKIFAGCVLWDRFSSERFGAFCVENTPNTTNHPPKTPLRAALLGVPIPCT